MNEKNHILILGGTGFLGKSLNKSEISNKFKLTNISSKVLDLRQNNIVEKLVDLYNENSTIIFLSAVKRNLGDSLSTYEMNLKIGINVIKAIQKKPVKNLIYLSSCAVYGERNNQLNFTESSKINPTSFYGASKVAIEELLNLIKNRNQIENLIILRPTTIYGDINIPTYCPSGFIGSAIKEKKIDLWGDGNETRDFFYINDFVEVIENILDNPTNLILNLCSGKSTTFNQLANKILFHLKKTEIKSKPRTNNFVNHTYNNKKLKKQITNLKIQNPIDWIDYFFKNSFHQN